jgi:hypothetical protein
MDLSATIKTARDAGRPVRERLHRTSQSDGSIGALAACSGPCELGRETKDL